MKYLTPSVVALAFTLFAGQSDAQQYVLNFDFETPNISSTGTPFGTGAFYQTLNAGSPVLTSWTIGGSTIDIVRQGTDYLAFSGAQYVDLAGSPGPGSVSQVFSVPAAGTYLLSFAIANNPGIGTSTVNVSVSDTSGSLFANTYNHTGSTANALGWTFTTVPFIATAPGNITINFADPTGGNAGTFLDDVTVVAAVPEPTTVAAGALLLGMVGLRLRRRAAKQA